MIRGSSRRHVRRFTAALAGTAVAAAAVGMAAPAHAAESAVGGVVVDGAGNPMTGEVVVHRYDSYDGVYEKWTTFDLDNGVISGTLFDGTYKLEVVGDGGFSEFYVDKADLASADVVTVADGAPVGLAPWVIEQPYVTATVTDAAGRPLSGAVVEAYDATNVDDLITSDVSDADGKVVLPVRSAPVKLHTTPPYSSADADRLAAEWFSDKADFASADPVTGTPTGTPVPIALGGGAAMTGQVLSDAGAPLEQVEVTAYSDSDSATDFTDKNGVYVLKGLDAGNYRVQFSDDRIDEYVSEYWNNATNYSDATMVPVAPGAYVPGINANLTPRPAKPLGSLELSGVVTDDTGAPVVGAPMEVWTNPAAPFKKTNTEGQASWSKIYTNRAGIYAFDELDSLLGKTVKVRASVPTPGDEDVEYRLFGQWFGQHTSYEQATPVGISAAPARADISLPRAGGISGSIKGAAGKGIQGTVSLLSKDGEIVTSASTEMDDTFDARWVYPGTYKVRFSDWTGNHAPEWWKNSTFDDAKTITVKSGQNVTGLDAVLEAALSATERPFIDGYPWVGKSIEVDPGEWNYQSSTQFTYEWLIGSTVVGTGKSFEPTKKQIGDKLSVRVLAENGKLVGTATTAKSEKIGYKSKIKAKIRGDRASIKIKAQRIKGKKVKGKLTVKEIVRVKDDGTIKYKKIGKTKIKKGKGTVSLKKLKKGKHKIVFFFQGKGKVGSSELTKTVKTKR